MVKIIRKTLNRVLTFSFRLLYHQFAWSYDFVSWIVSSGKWRDWTRVVFQYLEEGGAECVLELGFGPGHIQEEMLRRGIKVIGVDESRQMCSIANKRLSKVMDEGVGNRLVRGISEDLPLASSSADAVVATFPAEYIFHDRTLQSCHRVLRKNGKLIILMGVQPGGFSVFEIVMMLLYKVSKFEFQSLLGPTDYLKRLAAHGFSIEPVTTQFKKDKLWLLYGHKV